MNRLLLATLFTFLLLGTPTRLFAKGETVKITITRFDLRAPIEITDAQVLRRFNVWAGPGTGSSEPGYNPNVPSFVVDWSHGSVSNVPDSLTSYEVSFYAKVPNERLVYVVYYMYDPSAGRGYVYLPGKDDEFYRLNTSTIYHGVEGHWFRAWSAWDDVAAPLIKSSLLRYDPGEPGEATGTVVDLNGRPNRDARVYLKEYREWSFDALRYVMTDQNGQFWIVYLSPGDYDVFVAPGGSPSMLSS